MRGHVRKHGTGWQYTVNLETDPATGKRRQKSKGGFKTKKECEQAMNELMAQLESGMFFESKELVLREYIDYWLENYAKVNVAASTFELYKSFSKNIVQHIGNLTLKETKPAHIQNFYSKLLQDKSISKRQILKIHRMLHEALKHAVQWQLIINNPTDSVTAPRPEKTSIKVWDIDTSFNFLKDIKNTNLYIPVMLALTTGMRLGEIAALKWSDINFKDGFISVTHNFQRVENQYILKQPKTEKSKRSIAMMELTIKELITHKNKQKYDKIKQGNLYDDQDFICTWENGKPLRPHYISDLFRNYILRLDYPRIRFHDLRHTHATMLLSKGVNPKIVSERLGHSTVNITLDIYTHVLPNMQKEAVKKLDSIFEKDE